jgi:putative ABC transport system permease protein
MTLWLVAQTIRRAPRRLVLAALGVAFPVSILAATLLFVNLASNSMTQIALAPVQLEMRALATTLDVNLSKIDRKLAAVPGVSHVDRFASANVFVGTAGGGRVTARLFAVDPSYFGHHPWARVVRGSLARGALLDQTLAALPGFRSANRVSIELPGARRRLGLSLPATGTVDLRQALTTWFGIPTGTVQGDVALVPRAIVVDYRTFRRAILPALRAELGPATPVLDPGLTDLPPVSVESHVSIDHRSYPSDPGRAVAWTNGLRHVLETQAPGRIVVSDLAVEQLTEASADAANAKILFLLLGIPGALVAAALGLAAQSALTEAGRREDALLRLRGATDRQLALLSVVQTGAAALVGSAIGVIVAIAAVSAVTGQWVWHGVPASGLAFAILAAVALGVLASGVRLARLLRGGRHEEIAERRRLERGWTPTWRRAGLDFAAIGAGATVLAINVTSGGLKPTPVEGSTVALSFFYLLGPILLWLGLTLLAVRLLLSRSGRWARSGGGGSVGSWRGATLRWIARRPARTGVAVVLGSLAIAFGVEVVSFVSTYQAARQADVKAAFGSDLRLTPGNPLYGPPRSLGPQVAAVTPIRTVPARAGTDRKSILALDLHSYSRAITSAPSISQGAGIEALAKQPGGVLIAKEIATDLAVKPGDPLPLTILPDDIDLSRNITLRVLGVFRSIPPSVPKTEMVMNAAALPSYLLPRPDFYLAKDAPGQSPAAVAAELRRTPLARRFGIDPIGGPQAFLGMRDLTALNLGPLSEIESVGAALIAAIGVAVLGAFLVLERRREFAILRAAGADTAQIVTGPAQEGLAAVLSGIVIGVPIGLGLGILSVRILGLFFTLAPPLLTVPVGTIAGFVLLMAATSAIALGGALFAVSRVEAAEVLREP